MRLCADCIKFGGLVHTKSRDMQVILRLALVSKTVCTTVCVTLQLHTEHVAMLQIKDVFPEEAWLQHNYICRSVSTGLQTLETLSWNGVHVLQKVPCTFQPLGTHGNQNMAYRSFVRDFNVFISVVRGSMLASVSLFQERLNERKYGRDHN